MAIDPITVEIIRCALKAAANEMSAVLKKTAYNMMIYEVQDYCVSIVDHQGGTMSQNEGALPIFLADLGVAVLDGVEIYGLENINPGDVFLVFAFWRCARTGLTSAGGAPGLDRA
jgi:N-methylhydantoinase B